MNRHRPDPLSAALGAVVVLLSFAVMLRRSADVVDGGPWWIAVGALVVGLGLIPWRSAERADGVVGDQAPDADR